MASSTRTRSRAYRLSSLINRSSAGKRARMLTVTIVLLVLLAVPHLAVAQQIAKAVPRIGFIVSSGNASSPQLEAFRFGLHDLGYVEGKNIVIERRHAEGRLDRMSPFIREFVEQRVDVVIGNNNVVIRAAMERNKFSN